MMVLFFKVIAQQILQIIQAVQAKVDKFEFEGTEIRLNPNCYVCITMVSFVY